MSTFVLLSLALLALGLAYAVSLMLAVRRCTTQPEPLSGSASAVDEGLRVELRVERGPRSVTVDTITLRRETAVRSEAQPPAGFTAASADPVPALEAFEPDLDELALDFPDGDIPAEVVERERRRQHEEWRRLQERDAATTVRWHGRLRVRRRPSSVLLIPMRPDAAVGGTLVFGFRYRIGLVGVSESYTLPIGDSPRDRRP